MEARISFSVQGWVTQTVEIVDPSYTPAKLQEELNHGMAWTSIQDNEEVVVLPSGKVIGKVVYVEYENLEYADYEVTRF